MGEQLQYMVEGKLEPNGYQQITNLLTSQPLKVPKGARDAILQAVGQNIRWLDNDLNPTASIGTQLVPGKDKLYTGALSRLRFIEETASAELNVLYRGLAPSVEGHIIPDSIANLENWWDVDDTSTLTIVSDEIQGWTDKKGSLDFGDPGVGLRPAYVTDVAALNRRASIQFDGVDDRLTTGSSFNANIAEETIFLVGKFPSVASDKYVFALDGGARFHYLLRRRTDQEGGFFNGSSLVDGTDAIRNWAGWTDDAYTILVIRHKKDDGAAAIGVWDGGGSSLKTTTKTATGTANVTFHLGWDGDGLGWYDFEIAELFRYSRKLPFAEINSLCLNYLVPKWGAGAGEPSWTKTVA